MPVERRGQVTHVRMESTGNRRNSLSWRKPAGFLLGWHEPDELRGSCPDLWGTRGEIPRVYPAVPPSRQPLARCDYCAALARGAGGLGATKNRRAEVSGNTL